MKGIIIAIIIAIIVLLLIVVFLIEQNNHLVVTRYKYKNQKLPNSFNGYKIVQISDLHNKDFEGRLSKKIKKENPNAIFITGDIIDATNTNFISMEKFLYEIKDLKEIYYVSGNHEHLSRQYKDVINILEKYNVQALENKYKVIDINNSSIGILGVEDPRGLITKSGYIKSSIQDYIKFSHEDYFSNTLKELNKEVKTDFNILLAHRPESIDAYAEGNVDLVFSGHAHGGQIRLPFIGGLFSTKQGLFPKLTNGIHKRRDTSMVISRGLGNSRFPFRIFNRPEIVVVELYEDK